jgi:hypothetical protein
MFIQLKVRIQAEQNSTLQNSEVCNLALADEIHK